MHTFVFVCICILYLYLYDVYVGCYIFKWQHKQISPKIKVNITKIINSFPLLGRANCVENPFVYIQQDGNIDNKMREGI